MKNKILTLSLLGLVFGGLVLPTAVEAYRGDPNVKGPYYSAERHEAMTKAFANKDYNAWKNLMQARGRVTQVINKDNFARFAQMRQLMLEGKTEEANKIRTELGLGLHNGSGWGQKNGYRINR